MGNQADALRNFDDAVFCGVDGPWLLRLVGCGSRNVCLACDQYSHRRNLDGGTSRVEEKDRMVSHSFSIFGLSLFINRLEPWAPYEWLLAVGYVILILFFMHRRKWSLARFIPLLLSLALLNEVSLDWERSAFVTVMVISFGILLVAGRYFHRLLIGPKIEADAYTWTALFYIGYLNLTTMMDENVWIRVIPVLLLSIWFLFNAKKWVQPLLGKSFITLGFGCLYAGYIIVLLDYHALIPDLIEAELQVLPVLGVLFILRRKNLA